MYLKTGSNTKLGPGVAAFSLPAVHTCPGRTKLCESFCYATSGFFNMNNVKTSLKNNYTAAQKSDFADIINKELKRKKNLVAVRIHPAGDFYSSDYVDKWIAIAKQNPSIRFWAYTRCWRIPSMLNGLKTLADLPNVQLFASTDEETKTNKEEPPNWLRQADVQKDWSTAPRTYVRCPNLINKTIKCSTCQYCFKPITTQKINVVFQEH